MRIALEDALPAALVVTTLLGCDQGEPESAPHAQPAPSPAPSASAPAALSSALEVPAAAPSASVASTKPANVKFDVDVCCRALSALAKPDAEPPSKHTIAAAVCSGIARQVKKGNADVGSARVLVRSQLQGVSIPAGC